MEYAKCPSTIEWMVTMVLLYGVIIYCNKNAWITASCNNLDESQEYSAEPNKCQRILTVLFHLHKI